jgi:hypothetical protein
MSSYQIAEILGKPQWPQTRLMVVITRGSGSRAPEMEALRQLTTFTGYTYACCRSIEY